MTYSAHSTLYFLTLQDQYINNSVGLYSQTEVQCYIQSSYFKGCLNYSINSEVECMQC